jgi:hypothetical protein
MASSVSPFSATLFPSLSLRYCLVSFLECRGVVVGSLGALYRFGFDRVGSMTYIRTDGRTHGPLVTHIHTWQAFGLTGFVMK